MLPQLRAIFEQLGDKMRPKSAKMSQDRAGGMSKGRHMREDSDGRGSAEGGEGAGDPHPPLRIPPGEGFREGESDIKGKIPGKKSRKST